MILPPFSPSSAFDLTLTHFNIFHPNPFLPNFPHFNWPTDFVLRPILPSHDFTRTHFHPHPLLILPLRILHFSSEPIFTLYQFSFQLAVLALFPNFTLAGFYPLFVLSPILPFHDFTRIHFHPHLISS